MVSINRLQPRHAKVVKTPMAFCVRCTHGSRKKERDGEDSPYLEYIAVVADS